MRGARRLPYADASKRDFLLTMLHLAVMAAKLCGPGGVRAVIAENLLLKQQLIVLRRARQRAPNLLRSDRLLCGFWSLFLSPGRIRKVAVACRSRIRCQAATGSWTRSLQWETQRTWLRSARAFVCPPTKVAGVWPFNDAWQRAAL